MNMHKQYSCNEENEQQRKRSAFDIAQKYTGMSNTWQKYTIYFIKKKCIKKKEDSVLPRKKIFFKGMNFFFKKTSR